MGLCEYVIVHSGRAPGHRLSRFTAGWAGEAEGATSTEISGRARASLAQQTATPMTAFAGFEPTHQLVMNAPLMSRVHGAGRARGG